jgi:hypothetical protein
MEENVPSLSKKQLQGKDVFSVWSWRLFHVFSHLLRVLLFSFVSCTAYVQAFVCVLHTSQVLHVL